MLFEIPLADGSVVYMEGSDSSVETVVCVSTEKFWKIWRPSLRDDRGPSTEYAKKYAKVSACFNQSHLIPVALPEVGDLINYEKGNPTLTLGMVDGATRIQWLFDHGAASFPVLSSHIGAPLLSAIAGTNCK